MSVNSVRPECSGRNGYLSWDKANRAIKRGGFADRNGRGKINVYRCRHCQLWHVGRSAF